MSQVAQRVASLGALGSGGLFCSSPPRLTLPQLSRCLLLLALSFLTKMHNLQTHMIYIYIYTYIFTVILTDRRAGKFSVGGFGAVRQTFLLLSCLIVIDMLTISCLSVETV